MIRARDLERMRDTVEGTMTATATVYRKTQVSDSAGGFTDAFVIAFTSPCSFARALVTPLERESAVTVQTLVLWDFSFPAGTTILPTDRIVVGARTFEVLTGASGSLEIVTRVSCREIT